MNIKRLVIENFKSIERIELIEPNPFTVFVGPNGSGKSNIFEALEFVNYSRSIDNSTDEIFGGPNNFINWKATPDKLYFSFECQFQSFTSKYTRSFNVETEKNIHPNGAVFGVKIFVDEKLTGEVPALISLKNYLSLSEEARKNPLSENEFRTFFQKFSRIFVNNNKYEKLKRSSNSRLSLSTSNLEKVLGRLLNDKSVREEIDEWLSLFIPGFDRIEISSNNLTGEDSLLFYDRMYERPFTKGLISDGTYNILALLTAVYQSEEPQFLCIEEPENGLNPKVVKEFVNLCRYACEEFGHFIWLNTHSESLVSQLTPNEIILVDKKEGATKTRQIKGMNLHGLPMDEAWLSNALGGGIPW